ncbi:MAG: hypothetical protein JSR52_00330 [Planctomycetes bacterium]|nr:hypothetical protein [Planctomycetota bacterium]
MNEAGRGRPEFVGPSEDGSDQSRADELFVHGVLGAIHERADDAAQRRADAALGAVAKSGRAVPVRGRRLRRVAAFCAFALALGVGSWLMVTPATSQARATVLASLSAVRGAGDHRYEIRTLKPGESALPEKAEGVFDSADGRFLLRLHAPQGHTVLAGRDANGEWAIRRQGGIERAHAREAWPRWATADGEPVLADSVDTLLETLTNSFDLSTLESERIGDRVVQKIGGVRRESSTRGLADRVAVWIDAETKLLERLEMDWDRPLPPARGRDGAGPRDAEGGPPDRPDREGAPAEEFGGGPERGGRMRPPPPGGFPPPEGAGPPPPRPAHEPGMARQGPVMGPAMGPPMGPHKGGPIRKLVIQRIEAPEFAEDWFNAERHADGAWGEP